MRSQDGPNRLPSYFAVHGHSSSSGRRDRPEDVYVNEKNELWPDQTCRRTRLDHRVRGGAEDLPMRSADLVHYAIKRLGLGDDHVTVLPLRTVIDCSAGITLEISSAVSGTAVSIAGRRADRC